MTKGLGVREYRACTRCRTRKVKCDLRSVGEPGKPPCAKCRREGAECLLAGSRRGGDFSRFRRSAKGHRSEARSNTRPGHQDEATVSVSSTEPSAEHRVPRSGDDTVHDSLQNPSDALLILAHAAGQPGGRMPFEADDDEHAGKTTRNFQGVNCVERSLPMNAPDPRTTAFIDQTSTFALLQTSAISVPLILQLLSIYANNYHHFFPIVPTHILDPGRILTTVEEEPFLVTALLAVASKDRTDFADLNKVIWDHMKQRIFDVVLGAASIRKVGCVEGLLLLGEWSTLNQRQAEDGSEGAAWSIIGLAVRLAYLLRLEESSFKDSASDAARPEIQRERLAWTFIYLSDRQVSIRMGQAFWCRGPALSARFTAQDFPSLQPKGPFEEDFASWLQAQVELTTVFGNAHDILFASRSRTSELMTRGDYTKYVDDTNKAMIAWRRAWESITVSPHIKSCLTLMWEYLRLYVNAFAFQAVLYRASRSNDGSKPTAVYFPDSTMASADARHVYEAIDAAESLLKIVTEDFDPPKYLRYMPDRFYLYEIHSSVFLYKARVSGAISPGNHAQTRALIRRFISVLREAASDDDHIASRYAKLLHKLWFHRQQDEVGRAHPGPLDGLPFQNINADVNGSQLPIFDDLGLQLFDYTDPMEGLFAMPAVFSWDQPVFVDNPN